jgi:hypothetical protein
MYHAFRQAPYLLILGFLCASPMRALADENDDKDSAGTESIRRKTPSGEYVDPASFFRFHGYVSLSYTEAGKALGTGPDGTPHILVSSPGPAATTGRNPGGFRNDSALFVGGEPFDGVGGIIEIHFVGDATDPVITEAKLTWDLLENSQRTLRLVAGRYWWPFGIHNDEWFSANNRFALLSPAATETVPTHYNEVGAMLEGEAFLAAQLGLNYALSIGNGVPSFSLMPNVRATGADSNDDRSLSGRMGLVIGEKYRSEIGFSLAAGQLRDGEDATRATTDPDRYRADFDAWGIDLTLGWHALALRSYYYASNEDLRAAPLGQLKRDGYTIEPSYSLRFERERYNRVTLLGRYSSVDEQTLGLGTLRRTQLGLGINLQITRSFVAKMGFVAQGEGAQMPSIKNDAFTLSLTDVF